MGGREAVFSRPSPLRHPLSPSPPPRARIWPDLVVFSDANNHSSMIEGIRHSRAARHVYRHNDYAHLEELLRTVRHGARAGRGGVH